MKADLQDLANQIIAELEGSKNDQLETKDKTIEILMRDNRQLIEENKRLNKMLKDMRENGQALAEDYAQHLRLFDLT